ncbi:baseplate J/gp47 family protein [Methylomonas sp. 11b]|uniref:baseplate J/gp47 family protein n=1 Tax=Methylomonas sp. 11b TaxID=1168169 RepID=UPI00047D50E2|nr:baseplate J/gp47 family protein [Methylomonas sp. 11b]
MSNFTRPTLPEILTRVSVDMDIVGGVDPTQYNAIIEGLKQALSGVSHGLHGHLDYLATQYHPYTAAGLSLKQYAAVYDITNIAATAAGGQVTFGGSNGAVIAAGTLLQSRYGVEYATLAEVTIVGGSALAAVQAVITGAAGNLAASEVLSLISPIAGVNASPTLTGDGLTGGADIEEEGDLQARYFRRVRNPVQGGSKSDYETWALEFPGVTRAWPVPLGMGDGTVVVYFMMDDTYSNGIPLTADATALFNYIDPLRPAGMSGLYVVPPIATPLNPTIALRPNNAAVRAAVEAQLAALILDEAAPEDGTGTGVLKLSHIREAISVAVGETDHSLTSPTANVTPATGHIVTLGTVTFTTL